MPIWIPRGLQLARPLRLRDLDDPAKRPTRQHPHTGRGGKGGGNGDAQLAGVPAGEEHGQRARRGVEPVDDVELLRELAVGDPAGHVRQRCRVLRGEVEPGVAGPESAVGAGKIRPGVMEEMVRKGDGVKRGGRGDETRRKGRARTR